MGASLYAWLPLFPIYYFDAIALQTTVGMHSGIYLQSVKC